ncbi:hypothetical protein PAHAL_4G286900 [Panicum hallii]|uniref:Uncharacterized protein n=1 Tax=Panicum hallii TaxID=206008 RepID=A0A2S3HKW0_9POAL|nr:protein trichome birefringence-like 1 [Panicum hallii]PAN25253.1 hypothetical protein PAHAL_4G286900 [Panicum hallii]
MKSLWKQSGGLVCADAGPLSPLGGRGSRRRARLILYGFAAAFAALTAYVALAAPSSAGGAGAGEAAGGASWFGGVYASTAPYRSQISSFFSSILPADAPAHSPGPLRAPAGGSGGGGGKVSGGPVGSAAGSNSSAAPGSGKQLGSGAGAPIGNAGRGSVPPASDLAGTTISGKGGGGAPTNNSASSGGAPNGAVDRNNGNGGGVSSSRAGGGSGSPASSAAGDGAVAETDKQSGSGSGAPSNAAAGQGSTVRAEAKVGDSVPSNNSAGSSSSQKIDLSTGSSNNQAGNGSGVPTSGSASGNSSSLKADAQVAAGAGKSGFSGSGTEKKADLSKSSDAQPGSGNEDSSHKSTGNSSLAKSTDRNAGSNNSSDAQQGSGNGDASSKSTGSSSPAMSTDMKASSNNSSDAQPGSGSGDANHKSAGSSTSAKSNGGGERNGTSVSAVPTSNQTGSLALAGEKEVGSPRKNNTVVASPAVRNQEQTSSGVASGGSSGTVNKQKGDATQDDGSSGNKKVDWFKQVASCDMFHGHWVRDDSYPLYPEGSCPHIDEPFDCYLNGRRDLAYQKLRWQPSGCSIPRLNPTDMLERLRGKRLVFVGDSLNRNMWESLVCILRNSVKDKRKVFEASGRREFKTEGSYSFLFTDYNCSVEFFRSPFLVREWEMQVSDGKKKETLRLDLVEQSSPKYKDADFLIFNTGHWWTHEKTALGKDYYQEGNHVYSELNVVDAFHKALLTWSKWIDANVNPKKTTVLFRGYSASHFSGGQWNSGGSCDKESEPITNEQYLSTYPPKMSILEDVIHEMKTPVVYLNITRMTDYRKDAHPSIYRKQNLTDEERRSPERYQDCSHWCLPGVPDSWNELLYAQLLIRQHQMRQQ